MSAIITWVGDFVGFLVVIYVLWRYVMPPLKRAMNKERESVRRQLSDSKAAGERLEVAEGKYADAVAEARTEAAKIRDSAREDAQRIVVEMREQAEREVARIRQRGEEQLRSHQQQVIRELRGYIGELSSRLAARIVAEHVADGDKRAQTVDRFLDELEGMAAPEAESAAAPKRAGASVGEGDG